MAHQFPSSSRGLLAILAALVAAAACTHRAPGLFKDVTKASGVDFRWRSDIVEAKLIATMGGGVAAGDFNNDGKVDLFLPNSIRRARGGREGNADNCGKLYRGRGDGTFEDMTARSRIASAGGGTAPSGWTSTTTAGSTCT
jgi:hypothetical protein